MSLYNYLIITVIAGISAWISYNIAIARNRTGWKAALVGGILMIPGSLGIMIFLKSKGKINKRKNNIFNLILIGLCIIPIAGNIYLNSINTKLRNKVEFISQMNTEAEKGITLSGYSDTFIITTSLEFMNKDLGMTYKVAETQFKNGGIQSYSTVMLSNYNQSAPLVIKKLKEMGYKNLQARVLYRDGTIEASTIEKI